MTFTIHFRSLVLCASVLLTVVYEALAHQQDPQVVIRAQESVVSILPQGLSRQQQQRQPEGSGVVIQDGLAIVTASHVLGQSNSVLIRTHDGKTINGMVLHRDSETDLAIIVPNKQLKAIKWAASVSLTQSVCAIGNSFGLGLSVTCGVISAVNRNGIGFNPIEDFVQTDAAVNPGMSGGALINSSGELVGILSAIFTKSSDSNIGVNFAVSSRLAKSVIADLGDNGKIDREYSTMQLQQHNGGDSTGTIGAIVNFVGSNSPEYHAGIRQKDLIIAAGGRRVLKPTGFSAIVSMLVEGALLPVLVLRDGKPQEVTIDYWK